MLKNLVLNIATFRSGSFRRWLNHEGSNLINGLIHLWIHSELFGGSRSFRRCGLVGGSRSYEGISMKSIFRPQFLPATLLLLPGLHEVSSLVPPHDALPHHSQKEMELSDCRLHTLEVRTRLNSSSTFFLSGVLSYQQKVDYHRWRCRHRVKSRKSSGYHRSLMWVVVEEGSGGGTQESLRDFVK